MFANKALLNYITGRVLHCSTIAILSSQASNIITFIKPLWLLSVAFIVLYILLEISRTLRSYGGQRGAKMMQSRVIRLLSPPILWVSSLQSVACCSTDTSSYSYRPIGPVLNAWTLHARKSAYWKTILGYLSCLIRAKKINNAWGSVCMVLADRDGNKVSGVIVHVPSPGPHTYE